MGFATAGSTLLCMLRDTTERYLSPPLFDAIEADMNDEEIGTACSTPNYRFDTALTAPTNYLAQAEEIDIDVPLESKKLIEEIMQNGESPVIMFTVERCAFCWAVLKASW